MSRDPIEETLWSYVRGEIDDASFAEWAYSCDALQSVLGESDYIAIVGMDFRETSSPAYRERLKIVRDVAERRYPQRCRCFSIPVRARTNLGTSTPLDPHAHVLARRTPWIELVQCKECATHWLVGTDTVDDDVYLCRVDGETAADIMRDGRWPSVYEDHPHLWPGDEVRYTLEHVPRYRWPYFEDDRGTEK